MQWNSIPTTMANSVRMNFKSLSRLSSNVMVAKVEWEDLEVVAKADLADEAVLAVLAVLAVQVVEIDLVDPTLSNDSS